MVYMVQQRADLFMFLLNFQTVSSLTPFIDALYKFIMLRADHPDGMFDLLHECLVSLFKFIPFISDLRCT